MTTMDPAEAARVAQEYAAIMRETGTVSAPLTADRIERSGPIVTRTNLRDRWTVEGAIRRPNGREDVTRWPALHTEQGAVSLLEKVSKALPDYHRWAITKTEYVATTTVVLSYDVPQTDT